MTQPKAGPAGAAVRRAAPGFTHGDVARHYARLGAFMAMGAIAMNVTQVAEAVFLGMVGTEALAALGFAFPVLVTLFAFGGGIGVGASSVIARAMGAGQRERAALLTTHAQALTFVVTSALCVLVFAFSETIFTALGAQGVVKRMTIEYLDVYLLGTPFFLLAMVASTLLRATGRAVSPGVVLTGMALLQLALFPPLILGWLGRPALGIAGAAWASTIASFAAVAASATLLVRAGLLRWSLRGCWASWVAVLHVGGPAIAAGLIVPASALVVTRLLAGHGHEVVAGFNVASRVELLVVMILWCASASAEPLVGQNWGARRFDRVDSALRLANGFCIVWGALTCAVLVAFGGRLAGLIDANPVVVEVAEAFFLVVPASMGLMGVMQVASSCFNARGRPMPAFVISLGRAFALHVPLAILGNLLWGYHGIFLATAATNVLMGASAWAWNRRSVRRDSAALMAARG